VADVKVTGNMVLVIVLSDIGKDFDTPYHSITRAITAKKLDEAFIAKDSLKSGEVSTSVVRNKYSRRRKCDVISEQTKVSITWPRCYRPPNKR
jgi:hypothetical protein